MSVLWRAGNLAWGSGVERAAKNEASAAITALILSVSRAPLGASWSQRARCILPVTHHNTRHMKDCGVWGRHEGRTTAGGGFAPCSIGGHSG